MTTKTYKQIGEEIGSLVDEKNAAYGSSFAECHKILSVLYPNGIQPEQYTDALAIIRVIDKLFRIANKKDAFGESPWKDIAGYAILGIANDEYKNNTCKDYSVIKVLREQKRSNDYFEIMLNNLTLEEIIAVKLELTYKSIGMALYGFPIWNSTNYIVRDAILKYALSISTSKSMAARYLGVRINIISNLLKKYNVEQFFKKHKKLKESLDDNNRTTIKENLSEHKSG